MFGVIGRRVGLPCTKRLLTLPILYNVMSYSSKRPTAAMSTFSKLKVFR